jgi:hypothetical protein
MILEIGMYVRTENGMIGKITHFNEKEIEFDGLLYYCDYENCSDKYCYYETLEELNFITKSSFNLIDLIEVGDIVKMIVLSGYFGLKKGTPITNEVKDITHLQKLNDDEDIEIKSILTHEQYETNSYKKGE